MPDHGHPDILSLLLLLLLLSFSVQAFTYEDGDGTSASTYVDEDSISPASDEDVTRVLEIVGISPSADVKYGEFETARVTAQIRDNKAFRPAFDLIEWNIQQCGRAGKCPGIRPQADHPDFQASLKSGRLRFAYSDRAMDCFEVHFSNRITDVYINNLAALANVYTINSNPLFHSKVAVVCNIDTVLMQKLDADSNVGRTKQRSRRVLL